VTRFKLGAVRDFAINEAHPFEFDGEEIVVVRDGESLYAVEDRCSHAEVALSDGDVSGCQIECFLHGASFDVRTGTALSMPATRPIRTFPVSIEDPDGAAVAYVEIG
jgi:3-phenylpropionate/trans-cinnamate dioxygenase ferredoxin subunit